MAHHAEQVSAVVASFAVVMALASCGSSPAPQPTAATSSDGQSTASATRTSAAAPSQSKALDPQPVDREVFEFTAFRSPSGNIGCMIKPDYVRCDVAERNWEPPPRPADCEFDYGQGITMTPGTPAEFVCAGDTAQAPDADPLPYGETITAGPLRCESAEADMTCRDTETGRGFSISREAYRVF